MGEHEGSIVRQCLMHGMPIPDHILNAPQLRQGLEVYVSAFLALVSCRPLGFGVMGLIPWSAVDQYADHLQMPREDRADFWYIIHEVDRALLHGDKGDTDGKMDRKV